ncbi:radical SAM protein [Myxococcota bacterium]|nr:radical SAM protein [Myxococcota bacterium]
MTAGPGNARPDPAALLNWFTDRIHRLPIVVVVVTTRCNSLCRSCAYRSGGSDLPLHRAEALGRSLGARGTRRVAVSGGEPLVRADLDEVVDAVRDGVPAAGFVLLTNGVLLARRARGVAERFQEVIVSLDGWDRASYRAIRGVDGWGDVGRGVGALHDAAPGIRIMGRCTVHRANAGHLPRIADAARALGLDGISFLAADLSSGAFGRTSPGGDPELLLDAGTREELRRGMSELAARRAGGDRFVAEDSRALRRLAARLDAAAGEGAPPRTRCNAPWVSAVLEPDGSVRPCFFLPPHPRTGGSGAADPLAPLDAGAAVRFRRRLDVTSEPTCQGCACTLWMGPREVIGLPSADLPFP